MARLLLIGGQEPFAGIAVPRQLILLLLDPGQPLAGDRDADDALRILFGMIRDQQVDKEAPKALIGAQPRIQGKQLLAARWTDVERL
ncbi:MAG: hypothetical protein HGA45_17330 [Chloroflexales bacterium]|nr:hypothetical protein [Chloroflexales bacterium]